LGAQVIAIKTIKNEVVASRGVVVTNHPLASAAGVEMLAMGGNAFDAAIASLFTLTVVEPMMVGIFGGGFFIHRDAKTGKVGVLDNYAVSPKASTEDMYEPVMERKPGQYLFETVGRKNMVGHLAVAVPGTLKGWEKILVEHGRLGLPDVTEAAIRYAERGFPASAYLVRWINELRGDLALYPDTANVFLPGGSPPKIGDPIMRPAYAETLKVVASQGSSVLYNGKLGKAIVDDMEENGGLITAEDLAAYEVVEREPVKGIYRGFEVYSVPPVSSGGAHIVQMLNLFEGYNVASFGFGSPAHLHLTAEALKIAFADRQSYMGDPSRMHVPVEGITSKSYAVDRAKLIDPDHAKMYSPGDPNLYEGKGSETTHVSAMDDGGNVVAATQTLFSAFGSMVTTPGTGMILNNCMGLFDSRPGRANSVVGGKRMLSSMAPTIVTRDGQPFMCLGTPGGTHIFPAVFQAIVDVVDFGMTLQQAVEAPRIWTMGIKGTDGEKLHVEPGFPEESIQALRAKGHEIIVMPTVAGGMNGVVRDAAGLMHGAACWRADGTPMGLSGGQADPKALKAPPLV